MEKSPDAYRTISEAADELKLPQHVLRFWETRFRDIKPLKRGGGRRYYRPEDVDLLRAIQRLLYGEGYTIKGVQRLLKERGARGVVALGEGGGAQPADLPDVAAAPEPRPAPQPVPRTVTDDLREHAPPDVPPPRELAPGRQALRDLAPVRQALRELAECRRLLEVAAAH